MRFFSFGAVFLAGATILVGCGDDTNGGGGSGASPPEGGGGQAEGGGGAPPDGDAVTILNWNLHNFFDTEEDPSSESVDALSAEEYQEKLQAAAAILVELDPDVMVLQEVENEGVLQDLNGLLGNAYTETYILQGHDPRGVDIAAMTKIPFDDVVSHLDDTFEGAEGTYIFTRDLLEYHFTVGAHKVVLLGVHYKAKGPPDDPDKRLAEATYTREIADELTAEDPARGVIILGDFNDLPDSPPLDAIVGADPAYAYIAESVPAEDRWTFNFKGSLELIDHQMANPVMAGLVDPGSVIIRHGNDVETASDHAPLMATYLLE